MVANEAELSHHNPWKSVAAALPAKVQGGSPYIQGDFSYIHFLRCKERLLRCNLVGQLRSLSTKYNRFVLPQLQLPPIYMLPCPCLFQGLAALLCAEAIMKGHHLLLVQAPYTS